MTDPDGRAPRPGVRVLAAAVMALGSGAWLRAEPRADVMTTKHNLSASGPGSVRALQETRVCVFCHTPHNGAPLSPLWNKAVEPRAYTVYTSPTMKAGPLSQPWGPTKLCLSCHDGTTAMGAVLNPSSGISMRRAGPLSPGSLANLGLDLSGHHPVSFAYKDALPNDALASPPPSSLVYGGTDEVHCTTCHDPHDDKYGKFLVKDNRYSGLCTTCHEMPGWTGSAHATSAAPVAGILPRPPKTWPTYGRMNEWGCEVCHTPHFAPTAAQLLNFTEALPEPFACTNAGCHASPPPPPHEAPPPSAGTLGGPPGGPFPMTDIDRQVRKPSAHHGPFGSLPAAAQGSGGAGWSRLSAVGCGDCHNPHAAARGPAAAPYVSGTLQGVSGVDRNGAAVRSARYEYEVCFKCHADNASDSVSVPRVVSTTNLRRAFDTTNPSYHPVVGMGRNLEVPSIPTRTQPVMSASAMIYCSDCHADDEGRSRGPHGSTFPPILKARYETADGTHESPDSYALCYACHDRSSILRNASFRARIAPRTGSGGGHNGHLAAGASCAACHDPHGVAAPDLGVPAAGSHTHLVNFDTRIVLPLPGSRVPVFTDGGTFTGSCSLVCHGVTHANASYP